MTSGLEIPSAIRRFHPGRPTCGTHVLSLLNPSCPPFPMHFRLLSYSYVPLPFLLYRFPRLCLPAQAIVQSSASLRPNSCFSTCLSIFLQSARRCTSIFDSQGKSAQVSTRKCEESFAARTVSMKKSKSIAHLIRTNHLDSKFLRTDWCPSPRLPNLSGCRQ